MFKKVIPLALFALAMMVIISCKKQEEQIITKPRLVKIISIASSSEQNNPKFTFIAQPVIESKLSFQVSGSLSTFHVEVGKFFAKGAIIAQIDPRNFQVNVDRAKANFIQAKAEYERMKLLFEKKNIPQGAYEKSQAKYLTAQSDLSTVQNALSDTRLIAPFDGYIQDKFVENNQEIKAGEPIVQFINMQSLYIVASITEDVARNASNIQRIEVTFDAYPDKKIPVILKDIAKSSSQSNFSYKLTAQLENKTSTLKLLGGMTGQMIIHFAQSTSTTIALPIQAICNNQTEGTHVWVVNKDQTLSIKKIVVGELREDNLIEISSGLMGNETIVLAGQALLRQGEVVRTKN